MSREEDAPGSPAPAGDTDAVRNADRTDASSSDAPADAPADASVAGRLVTDEQLEKYFAITREALAMAKDAPKNHAEHAADILDMVERYISDAEYFSSLDNKVLAFAALNYAHGWLDCGARTEVFEVADDRLFTVDPKDSRE